MNQRDFDVLYGVNITSAMTPRYPHVNLGIGWRAIVHNTDV